MSKIIKDTQYPVDPKWLRGRLTQYLLRVNRLSDNEKNRDLVAEMEMDQISVRDFVYELLRELGPNAN